MKKILFAVSSLGLGHATRTLPIIKHFATSYGIDIISYGNALKFLKTELKDFENINFIEIEDYPLFERGEGFCFYFYLIKDLITTNNIIKKEHKQVLDIEKDYEFIFSDGRYGVYSKTIPSFLLSHQISFMPPKFLGFFKFISDIGNLSYFRNFNTVFIPDFKDYKLSLAGKLSHNYLTSFFPHKYIGILSSYKKMDIKEDIDYLFLISGYLIEQKNRFISKLLEEAKKLDGKKVFVLGDTSRDDVEYLDKYDITIYPFAAKELRAELLNRAKTIISRTGYTTIMDLVELNKKAILFPTQNSTEQEYLAKYHKIKGDFVICEDTENFDLKNLSEKVSNIKPINSPTKTKEAIEIIENTILKNFKKHFFSIIIPASNEEKYISNTLENLSKLNYYKDKFEIIVVENGSVDNTLEIVKSFKEKIPNLKILTSKKGISVAKNKGLENIDETSDYTIFLDADVIVKENFLKELNNFLNKNSYKNLAIGTTKVRPYERRSLSDDFWFLLLNLSHLLTKTSCSIQIAKSDIAKQVKYDEDLNFSEDLKFIKSMLVFGDFFYLNTNSVFISIRKFMKKGYVKTFSEWIYQALMPESKKKNKSYDEIR